MKKRICAVALTIAMALTVFTGCGEPKEKKLEGTSEEILNRVYENADLDAGFRGAMEHFQTVPVDESMEEYILGTTDVEYTDAVASMPMITSIAYQCVILRVPEDANVAEVKQQLTDNADMRKWICVEAESLVVENVGDVVLCVMADRVVADAIKASFLALGEA